VEKKELMEQLDALKTELKAAADGSVKNQIEAKMAELKTQLEAIAEVKNDVKVIKDAAEKNQSVIDEFVANKNKPNINGKSVTFNDQIAKSIAEKADELRNLKKGNSVSFETKVVADMDFATNFSTADNSVTQVRPGIIELPKRKLHIRQLLQGGTMSTSNFAYVKEVTGEEGPEAVAEGSAKNQFHVSLQETSVPAEYIAGYIRMSKKLLEDPQGMTTFLQSRLLELLLREEDDQLINGTGTSPQLSGITDSGNYTAASTSETAEALMLIDAISQLEGYDREANGILLHPTDYWTLAKLTNLNQSSVVVTSENGVLRIGGVPVFRSTACAVDQYIVGDWAMGANFLVREAPKVEFFFEDKDNVTKNQVTVRVEERVAFPIYGSNYFIVGDFGNVS